MKGHYDGINLSEIFAEASPYYISNSDGNLGEGSWKITWANALVAAEAHTLDVLRADDLREYFADFGAWDREELAAMSALELRAMVVQCIAADIMLAQDDDPDLYTLAEALDRDWDSEPEYPTVINAVYATVTNAAYANDSGAILADIYLGR